MNAIRYPTSTAALRVMRGSAVGIHGRPAGGHRRRNVKSGMRAPGVFPLVSVPTVVGCAGALLIVVAAIATPIARTQKMRELWFYGMSGGAVLKIATMEIARLVL